jgi:cytochrome oxidase Cu insertion factor (SCO1/SenC/PrrC family)
MSEGAPLTEPRKPTQGPRAGRHPLLWIAAIAIAPIVASYAIYYLFPKAPTANYGTLMPTAPIPGVEGTRPDGSPFRLDELRGRWVLVAHSVGGGACDAACERRLYATRQARTIQGKEQERVVRVLLVTGSTAPGAAWLAEHPGLVVARVTDAVTAKFPAGPSSLYLIDPLGNLVLSYPDDPDIKGIARDLTRLLKASRIG